MELELVKEKSFPLLSRKRVSFMCRKEGAVPSRIELKKEIAKSLKTQADLVIVKHVYSQFGGSRAKVIAHVYDNKDKMSVFENEKLIAKHQEKAAAPAAQ